MVFVSLLMLEKLFPSMVVEHQCHTTNELDENSTIQKPFTTNEKRSLPDTFTDSYKIYFEVLHYRNQKLLSEHA